MIFSCRGMVWGVEWILLVGVGVGIKKNQGGHWSWKYAFLLLFESFRGVKDKGSEIGWGWRERKVNIFSCGGWCGELVGYIWLG